MAAASTDPNKYGVEEAVLMPMMAENRDKGYTGHRLLSQQSPAADKMILELETGMTSAPAKKETLKFQRFGGAWKVVIDEDTVSSAR